MKRSTPRKHACRVLRVSVLASRANYHMVMGSNPTAITTIKRVQFKGPCGNFTSKEFYGCGIESHWFYYRKRCTLTFTDRIVLRQFLASFTDKKVVAIATSKKRCCTSIAQDCWQLSTGSTWHGFTKGVSMGVMELFRCSQCKKVAKLAIKI